MEQSVVEENLNSNDNAVEYTALPMSGVFMGMNYQSDESSNFNSNGYINANEYHGSGEQMYNNYSSTQVGIGNSSVSCYNFDNGTYCPISSKNQVATNLTPTQSYAVGSSYCKPSQSELSYTDRNYIKSFPDEGRNSAGYVDYQVMNNYDYAANNKALKMESGLNNVNQSQEFTFSNTYPMSAYEENSFNHFNDNSSTNDFWSCQKLDDFQDDKIESRSVYSTDYQPFAGAGNNFNHFPNSKYMNYLMN